MNEVAALEKNRERIEKIKGDYLEPADWKISDERRENLNYYKTRLKNTGPNMPASKYKAPFSTQFDITKISKSTGIRCMQLETDQFNHKIPLDRILMSLELARPHDNIENIIFPYGYTQEDSLKVTNVIMPIDIYESLSKEISTNFETGMVYNQ